jgi:hypothetical protein
MGNDEKTSYLMLFCALMLVRKSRMGLKDLVQLYPFEGQAQSLAQKLAGLDS